MALFIVLERDIPGFDPYVNGHSLGRASRELDALASRLEVTSLMEFFSANPEDLVAEFGELPDGRSYPPEVWYEAEDGLKTVGRLLTYLIDNPGALSESSRVVEDLREFQSVLQRASAERVRWNLYVDN